MEPRCLQKGSSDLLKTFKNLCFPLVFVHFQYLHKNQKICRTCRPDTFTIAPQAHQMGPHELPRDPKIEPRTPQRIPRESPRSPRSFLRPPKTLQAPKKGSLQTHSGQLLALKFESLASFWGLAAGVLAPYDVEACSTQRLMEPSSFTLLEPCGSPKTA